MKASEFVDKIAVAALLEFLWKTEHCDFVKMEGQIKNALKEKTEDYSIVETIGE